MIVLQLVSQQFTNNETQLKSIQSKNEFTQQLKENKLKCESLCKSEKTEDRAAYCMTYFEFSSIGGANKTDFTPGVVVCEDRVYCSQLYPCETLDVTDCPQVLCSYWMSTMKLDSAKSNTLLDTYLKPGLCYDKVDKDNPGQNYSATHWFNSALDQKNNAQTDRDAAVANDGKVDYNCAKAIGN
jgi:hypothetical protein